LTSGDFLHLFPNKEKYNDSGSEIRGGPRVKNPCSPKISGRISSSGTSSDSWRAREQGRLDRLAGGLKILRRYD
jgi:hypothetical protein